MKQRLLILGKRGGILQWYEHLLDAGSDMLNVDIDGFALNHNNFLERTVKKLSGSFGNSKSDKITALNLTKKIKLFQPTTIVIADLFYLPEQILNVLSNLKGRCHIAHWIGDFFDERLKNSSQIIDQYYFSDTGLVANALAMGLLNSSYLPLAFNPNVFNTDQINELRSNELLFIGAWSNNREELMRSIKLPMRIIGKGWGDMKGTPHNVFGKNISLGEVASLYRQHNFVLNNINSNNINCGLNMRCFEAPASGALLITDNVPDIELCYEPGAEVVVYGAGEDVLEFYLELIEDVSRREEIQCAGVNRVNQYHTYQRRLESVFDEYTT
ncbi:MAG: glycosyltransferase [Pseudomonadales bacterium]|nr:glycosyltransferase [Pseudomonadales bacterium]